MTKIDIIPYVTKSGAVPYREWLKSLTDADRYRIETSVLRVSDGNTGALKGLGQGLQEIWFFFGRGYRVYCTWDGDRLIILLGGGDKSSQDRDIRRAREMRAEYFTGKGKPK